jgi:hypothetical protein
MITSDDLTTLAEGAQVPAEGPVICCPVCGRNGVLEHEPCGPRCVHAEKVTVLADGMLVEFTDSCELPVR